jgi:hypothetical protein
MKKKVILTILASSILILFVIPATINYVVSNGLYGFKPFRTEFTNAEWFQFWYAYLPSSLAFLGTLTAISITLYQMNKLRDSEQLNRSLQYMPTLQFNFVTLKDLFTISKSFKDEFSEIELNFTNDKQKLLKLINSIDFTKETNFIKNQYLIDSIENPTMFEPNSAFHNHTVRLALEDSNIDIYEFLRTKKKLYNMNYFQNILDHKVLNHAEHNTVKLSLLNDNFNQDEVTAITLELEFINIGKFDIKVIKFKNFELIENNKIVRFEFNKEFNVLFSHTESSDIDNTKPNGFLTVNFYANSLEHSDFYEKDFRLKMYFEIQTEFGFKYSCVSDSLISSKKLGKKSNASVFPI